MSLPPAYSVNFCTVHLTSADPKQAFAVPLGYRWVITTVASTIGAGGGLGSWSIRDLYTSDGLTIDGVIFFRHSEALPTGESVQYTVERVVINDEGAPLNGFYLQNEGAANVDISVSGFVLAVT